MKNLFLSFMLPLFVLDLGFAQVLTTADAPISKGLRRDAEAVEILGRVLTATHSDFRSVENFSVEAELSGKGVTGAVLQKGDKRGRLRTEFRSPQRTGVSVSNERGYFRLKDGRVTKLPLWSSLTDCSHLLPGFGRLADFARTDVEVKYVGTEQLNGRIAYKIAIGTRQHPDIDEEAAKHLPGIQVYVDSQSFLVTKIVTRLISQDVLEYQQPLELYFLDYESMGGIAVPRKVVRQLGGQELDTITLTRMGFNEQIPEQAFDAPEGNE